MPGLYLAANHVNWTGGADFGHLQIVYDDGTVLWEIEIESKIPGLWAFEPDQAHAGSNTPYYGDPDNYSITQINLGSRSATEVWDSLVNLNDQFLNADPGIAYNLGKIVIPM